MITKNRLSAFPDKTLDCSTAFSAMKISDEVEEMIPDEHAMGGSLCMTPIKEQEPAFAIFRYLAPVGKY